MERKRNLALPLLLLSVTALSGCGKGPSYQEGERQRKEDVESFSTTYGNERTLKKEFFANPANQYRVMPVNNDSPLSPGGPGTGKIDEYLENGYGGVVLNTVWGENYLRSESNFDLIGESIEYAIEKGMRVMLYDEDGYPSGKAQTLTLAATPEGENWEAQGLVANEIPLSAGEAVVLEGRHGHHLEHAYLYPSRGLSDLSPKSAVDLLTDHQEGDSYVPSENGLLVLLYSKNWYEGTHFQNNLVSAAHYIDLMKEEPVQEFLSNTYEKYYEKFGEYFGNGIESFFFDEPSLPGMYFSPTNPLKTYDEPDGDIAQYPAVNFDDEMVEEFNKRYGYDPSPYLPYLFERSNANEDARRFRYQYYRLLSDRVSSSWSKQIGEWTLDHGVRSSGHFLCEEDVANHPLMLGNYMNNYHEMPIPGIDMTHGAASYSIQIANVAKQATSMAAFDLKQDVFCEIGQDEGAVDSAMENIANVAILQSMGINYLTSYYRLKGENDQLLANSLARINYLLAGNASEKSVAVFYPIDGVYAAETPYNRKGERIYTGSWGFNEHVEEIGNCYAELARGLVKNQIDYDIFNDYMVTNSRVENGALVTPNGQRFPTFVVPFTTAMDKAVLEKLLEAADGGVNILLQDVGHLTSLYEEDQQWFDSALSTLIAHENVTFIGNHSTNDLIARIAAEPGAKTIPLAHGNSQVVGCKKDYGDNVLYFLVNSSAKPQALTIKAPEVGTEYLTYDVYEGTVDGMCVTVDGGVSEITVTLPAFGVGAYSIGGIAE